MVGIGLVAGIAILKGLNWGRILYLLIVPILILSNSLIQWLLFGFGSILVPWFILARIVLPIIFYTIVFIFLTKSTVSAFFANRSPEG